MPRALVTGGAIRIGRAISLALADAGYDVIVQANRSREAAESLRAEFSARGRALFVESADLSVAQAVSTLADRVLATHHPLDLIVHNAGAYEHAAFEAITPAQFDAMFAVNVRAPFVLTQALLPALRAAAAPSIVAITDMAVTHAYTATHFFAHYLASKAALSQLVRAWALELGPAIRVNAVAPGPVAMASETTSEQRRDMLHRLPLKREGTPEDIARAVVFLASENARYITGQTVVVDGGLSVA